MYDQSFQSHKKQEQNNELYCLNYKKWMILQLDLLKNKKFTDVDFQNILSFLNMELRLSEIDIEINKLTDFKKSETGQNFDKSISDQPQSMNLWIRHQIELINLNQCSELDIENIIKVLNSAIPIRISKTIG